MAPYVVSQSTEHVQEHLAGFPKYKKRVQPIKTKRETLITVLIQMRGVLIIGLRHTVAPAI